MCKMHSTIWSKNISSGLSPAVTFLSASSKTKRSWEGTGKEHYNVWPTPLLKEVMNTAVNKNAAYATHGKLWEKGNTKWKNDFMGAIFLSGKIWNYTIKKSKKAWTDYRNKTDKK